MIINEDIVRQIEEDEMFQMGTKQGIEHGEIKKSIIGIINMAAKGFDINMTAEVLEVTPEFASDMLEQYKKKGEIEALLKKPRASVERIAKKMEVSAILVEVIKDDMEG